MQHNILQVQHLKLIRRGVRVSSVWEMDSANVITVNDLKYDFWCILIGLSGCSVTDKNSCVLKQSFYNLNSSSSSVVLFITTTQVLSWALFYISSLESCQEDWHWNFIFDIDYQTLVQPYSNTVRALWSVVGHSFSTRKNKLE